MNKKLKRLIEDEENTTAKIEELQTHLKEVRIARKQEEDLEIVRSVRARKLGARDLFELLEGIQTGRIMIEPVPDPDLEESGSEEGQTETKTEGKDYRIKGARDAPESEEKNE